MSAPKIVIDEMLREKYHWTPQQIDDIPKEKMDEIMLLMNARLNVSAEIEWKSKNKILADRKNEPKVLGASLRPPPRPF